MCMAKALFSMSCLGKFFRRISYSIVMAPIFLSMLAPNTISDSVRPMKCIPFGNMRHVP
jgi:hypothetical protein